MTTCCELLWISF